MSVAVERGGMVSDDRMRRTQVQGTRDHSPSWIKGVTGIEVARLRKTIESQAQAAMVRRSREKMDGGL